MVNNCRALGAHFNATGGKMAGTTLTQRRRTTARSTGRLKKTRAPYEKKVAIMRGKKLPMGLFGCEVAPVNEGAMRMFRSAIASRIAFTTSLRATDLTFATGSRDRDVDPDIGVVCRRALGIRRCMATCDESKRMIE